MLNLFKSQHSAVLGIDISSTSVKMIEISKNGEQYCVENYGRAALPENAVEGNMIKDVDVVANTIKQLLDTKKFHSKLVACAVPESSAISKVIQMNDGLNVQEIEELVVGDSDKYIPYPIDEINLDFDVIGPSAKNPAMVDVLIVASKTENITVRVDVMAKAGLIAKIVDVESFAIERALQCLKPDLPAGGEKKNIAFIDIGAMYTHLSVLRNMKIIFSHEEEFGGKQLVDAVMHQYGMSRIDALMAIEQGSLPTDYADTVLHPFKESILLQVKRALQLFFSSSHYTYVDHIVLAGGVAKLPFIAQLLREHISIPTSVANPFAHMSVTKQVNRETITNDSPVLMIACGLALRQIE